MLDQIGHLVPYLKYFVCVIGNISLGLSDYLLGSASSE